MSKNISSTIADSICHSLNHEKAWIKYFPSDVILTPGGKLSLNSRYKSPFRPDKTPRCSFTTAYNRKGYIFRDFVDCKYYDIFQVVSIVLQLNFYDAVMLIAEDEELYTDEIPEYHEIKRSPYRDLEQMEYSTFDHFPDRDYFLSGGITLKTLEEFGVAPAKYVKYKHELQAWHRKNPLYLYKFDDNYSQTYRPFAKADCKFRSNVPSSKIVGLNKINKIPSKETIILTKSYKDVMVLHECGYPAITAIGEGITPNRELMQFLNLEYKNFFILYDNDATGVRRSQAIKQEFDFLTPIFMPEETKDPFGFSSKHNIPELQKYLYAKTQNSC